MIIESFPNGNLMSKKATSLIYATLIEMPDSLICATTGNSTVKKHHIITEEYSANPEAFGKLKILKLDEWGGIERGSV